MSKKRGFWSSLFGPETKSSGSANTATERLKVIVASENRLNSRLTADRIEKMKREILEVVNKYVNGVQINDVNINHRHEDNLDVLEMNINLPDAK
ncbi:cell division topological specificity factor MinE [Psychrobacter sanguinis]|jgi:cell division topological specificity factor|uniref:cell division topological specificity factor MinE n=1 Tax=Psychrobacter sanguinis TaxID=861445 RepID=UPI00020C65E7|nr:cell division topological specificity factor MinE [Psychrobacter sanguinis]EGK07711.1 cell division topological specificity factor [Psychrobacter sp. 1501(2011)]MCC3309320.1 cell division topological specificity factor MinE [Psychrobacter sanguinis]MCC3345468.1 cell division topological specificity factor MinE [Psychrobacter sanguinis]MCD9152031.1 cell division topological specificity factor MinE [Psychrobacter sanguinis]MDY3305219.1 cell division topological specificity factor MinE [Psychr